MSRDSSTWLIRCDLFLTMAKPELLEMLDERVPRAEVHKGTVSLMLKRSDITTDRAPCLHYHLVYS